MEDIELIILGFKIWPREFETVTYLLMIRAIPYSHTWTLLRPIFTYCEFCISHFLFDQVECEEFKPRVDLAWRKMAYDLWVAYDVRIGQLPNRAVVYSIKSIEIHLIWWKLACDEQLCLKRSSFTFLWEDYLWDYYETFGVWFDTRFQRVDVVISDWHRSSISIIWGLESTMFETVVIGWVAFISVSSYPIIFIDIWTIASPLSLAWAS